MFNQRYKAYLKATGIELGHATEEQMRILLQTEKNPLQRVQK